MLHRTLFNFIKCIFRRFLVQTTNMMPNNLEQKSSIALYNRIISKQRNMFPLVHIIL